MITTPKCQFYLATKRRDCKAEVKPGCQYCGNHLFVATQQGKRRVPCPVDPRHTVLEAELEVHVKRCPSLLAIQAYKAQPYICENINEGSGDEPDLDIDEDGFEPDDVQAIQQQLGPVGPFAPGTSQKRATWARAMGWQAFGALVERVQAAHLQVCQAEVPVSVQLPDYCKAAMAPDNNRPYSSKHGIQQASMIGNLERVGLLQCVSDSAVIEFGAGKGYLSALLADVAPVRRLLLTDVRRCFRNKADRTLRHLQLERVHADIKDFDIARLPCMQQGTYRWLGIGKHLCGAATDYMLRSCLRAQALQAALPVAIASAHTSTENNSSLHEEQREGILTSHGAQSKQASVAASAPADPRMSCHQQAQMACTTPDLANGRSVDAHNSMAQVNKFQQATPVGLAAAADPLCGTDERLQAQRAAESCDAGVHEAAGGSSSQTGWQGLAVAPCCHHRCGWKAYVGKHLFQRLGFSPSEFETISWMTGWALCGHNTPAGMGAGDGGSDASDEAEEGEEPEDPGEASSWEDVQAQQGSAGQAPVNGQQHVGRGDGGNGGHTAREEHGYELAMGACTSLSEARGSSKSSCINGWGADPGCIMNSSTDELLAMQQDTGLQLQLPDGLDLDQGSDLGLDDTDLDDPLDDDISNQISEYLALDAPQAGPSSDTTAGKAAGAADGAGLHTVFVTGKEALLQDNQPQQMPMQEQLGATAGDHHLESRSTPVAGPQSNGIDRAAHKASEGQQADEGDGCSTSHGMGIGSMNCDQHDSHEHSATGSFNTPTAPMQPDSTPNPPCHVLRGQGKVAAGADGDGMAPSSSDPLKLIAPLERVRIGKMCKDLIDLGRLQWMQQQGWRSEMVVYCPPEVSGENKLLLAVRPN